MNTVIINHEPVALFKLLKFEGLVSSGAEAKLVIADGLVTLNNKVETRKAKKIVAGDEIEFNGEQMKVVLRIE